jgi:hypothetical protein
MTAAPDDPELLARARSGERTAFDALVAPHLAGCAASCTAWSAPGLASTTTNARPLRRACSRAIKNTAFISKAPTPARWSRWATAMRASRSAGIG